MNFSERYLWMKFINAMLFEIVIPKKSFSGWKTVQNTRCWWQWLCWTWRIGHRPDECNAGTGKIDFFFVLAFTFMSAILLVHKSQKTLPLLSRHRLQHSRMVHISIILQKLQVQLQENEFVFSEDVGIY